VAKSRQRARADRGFTLIELLIVVLVLGVIMAIAIPVFLSETGGASAAAAQSNLTILLKTENRQYVTGGAYLSTGAALQADQPALVMAYPSTTDKNAVYAYVGAWSGFDDQSVTMASSDGVNCWYIYDGAADEPAAAAAKPVPPGAFYATGPPASNGYCITALAPTHRPTVGSATKGTPLTWYTNF
jgi:prepilin-type N-terminal cleavage/methylation domain-containing protein